MEGEPQCSIDLAVFERPDVQRRFEGIRARLARRPAFASDPIVTNAGLARLTGELQQFMERSLGRLGTEPRHPPKLPSQLFRDFRPTGSLYAILEACVGIKVRPPRRAPCPPPRPGAKLTGGAAWRRRFGTRLLPSTSGTRCVMSGIASSSSPSAAPSRTINSYPDPESTSTNSLTSATWRWRA